MLACADRSPLVRVCRSTGPGLPDGYRHSLTDLTHSLTHSAPVPLDPLHISDLMRLRRAREAHNCGAGRRAVGHAVLAVVDEEIREIVLQ